jgi:regulatory protein
VSKVEHPPKPPKKKPELTPAGRALRLLARREHTRRELGRKLAPHVEDAAELEALLDDFTERGWLSEARAADQLVNAKRERFGVSRIRRELQQRGVSDGEIGRALVCLTGTELDRARAVHERKFRTISHDPADQARRVRFLQSRGFSLDIAMRVARSRGEDSGE